jgi:hypothetical protein
VEAEGNRDLDAAEVHSNPAAPGWGEVPALDRVDGGGIEVGVASGLLEPDFPYRAVCADRGKDHAGALERSAAHMLWIDR